MTFQLDDHSINWKYVRDLVRRDVRGTLPSDSFSAHYLKLYMTMARKADVERYTKIYEEEDGEAKEELRYLLDLFARLYRDKPFDLSVLE